MTLEGLTCRELAEMMGKSKSTIAGKVNTSIPWRQADLIWLATELNLPSGYVLDTDRYLVGGGWNPNKTGLEPDSTRLEA